MQKEKVNEMKEKICALAGLLGGAMASLFGPWTSDLTALTVCMAVDFLSGVAVALLFHKSKKTPTGAYSSACGFAGLCKKAMLLALVDENDRGPLLSLLAEDPRPSYQDDPARIYGMPYGRYDVQFTVAEGCLHVCDVLFPA